MALSRFEEVSLWHFSKKNSQWLTTLSILPYLHHVTKQCFTDHHGPVSCTALQSCQTCRIFLHLKLTYRATSMTNTCRLSTVSAKWQLTSFVKLEYLYLGATFLSFCSMNKAQVCSPSWIHQNPLKKTHIWRTTFKMKHFSLPVLCAQTWPMIPCILLSNPDNSNLALTRTKIFFSLISAMHLLRVLTSLSINLI